MKWKRSFEAGYSYQANGNQVSNTSTYVRAEIVRESPGSSVGFLGRYVFGEQNSQRNTDKLDTDLKFNFDYANRVLLRNDFMYSYDRLKQLAARTLDGRQQETVGQIRNYVVGARSALKEGDVRRAGTLAEKAHLLVEDLVKH